MGRHVKEKWKLITCNNIRPRYYISNWGRLKNDKDKILSTYIDKDGYPKCTLYTNDGIRKHFMVHRLVAIHFIPNLENKPEVNHINPYDKSNAYFKNLEWCTHQENIDHSIKHRLQLVLSCESHGRATLTDEQVHKICKLMEDGYTNKEICKKFGYRPKTKKYEKFRGVIKHIRARKTWIPISENYKF